MTCRLRAFAPALAAAVLTLSPQRGEAERLFVGVLEADGYQSLLYSASAFSRVADLPSALETVNAALAADALLLPSLTGVAPAELLRVVQTVDPALPRGDDNPAHVALIPLAGPAASLHDLFATAYSVRRSEGVFTCYEKPSSTNLAPRVYAATAGRHALTSTCKAALAWAWQNRTRLLDAPPQSIPGTLRVLVSPPRFADVLGARTEQASFLFNLDRLVRDFESLSFALTLEGQTFALTLRGKPLEGSSLSALAAALHTPADRLWNGPPDGAFFVSLSACDRPALWEPYLGTTRLKLLRPSAGTTPASAYTGESLLYLAPTRDQCGLCLVHAEPVTNAAAAAEGLRKLDGLKLDEGISLKRGKPRRAGATDIETFAFVFPPPAAPAGGKPAADPSVLYTLLSLFLKQAALEAAVQDGCLLTLIGPPNTLEGELERLSFEERPLTLRRRLGAQDPALSQNLYEAASVQVAALLRHLVSIMPGVRPEQLRALPSGGDGATFGLCPGEGGVLTASLRVQTTEIAALQRINRDGREVLQELFFQMFSSQMLDLRPPEPTPDKKP